METRKMETTKGYKERAFKKIKEAIQAGSFKIKKRVYVPLHSTSYLPKILKELKKEKFLVRTGTLITVLAKYGLTRRDYIKMSGKANAYHQNTTCFEVFKKII